jgi:hypothetical protein
LLESFYLRRTGETTIASLFYPNLSSSPDRRNNNHFFVLLKSFYLRRMAK